MTIHNNDYTNEYDLKKKLCSMIYLEATENIPLKFKNAGTKRNLNMTSTGILDAVLCRYDELYLIDEYNRKNNTSGEYCKEEIRYAILRGSNQVYIQVSQYCEEIKKDWEILYMVPYEGIIGIANNDLSDVASVGVLIDILKCFNIRCVNESNTFA